MTYASTPKSSHPAPSHWAPKCPSTRKPGQLSRTALALGLTGALFACSSVDGVPGDGGATAEDGSGAASASSGGATGATGGAGNTTGGATSTGGNVATGGDTGTGGNVATGGDAGTGGTGPTLDDVNCFEDIQDCIDSRSSGSVILGPGTYTISTSIHLKSNVNLLGQGSETIITWDDSVADTANRPLIESNPINYGDLDNVRLEDFQILCTVDTGEFRKRQRGIFFDDDEDESDFDNTNITLKRLEIFDCGGEGVKMNSVEGLLLEDLTLNNNGGGTEDFWHNIYLAGGADITVRQTTLTSGGLTNAPTGHGIRLSRLSGVYLENLRVVGNADHGIHMNDVDNAQGVNLEVTGNCASPLGGCSQVACYGDCDYEFTFAAE